MNVAAGAATPIRRPWPRVDFWGAVTVGALGVFVLLLVYPLLRLFAASLSGEDGAVATVLHTYGEFFTRRYYYETLVNSLVVSALATVLATLLGAPLAWFVNRFDIPGKLLVRALIVLTFVSPPFIGAYAWILLLGRNGVITGWLAQLGLALPPIYGVNGVVLVFTLQALPFVFLMVSAGLKTVDQSVEDAAINLGRRPSVVALTVIAPLIVPSLATGALLVFVTSLSDFGTPMIIGESFRVLASQIYTEFVNEHGGNPVVASALSLILLAITVGALLWQRAWVRKRSFGQETVRPLAVRSLSRGGRIAATVYVYALVLAASLPIVTIVVSSFLKARGPLITGEFTLEGYANALRLPHALFNTVMLSTVSTILCVAAGALAGYVVARRRGRLVDTLDAFSMVPYAVAGVVMGIAMAVAFGGKPFYLGGTVAILVAVYFIRRLPYSIRSVAGMLGQMGTQAEEASVNLGVPPGRTFWRVTVPMVTPALLSGALLTFATIAREFSSTVILYSGATRTLPVEVFAQVLQGNFASASVVGTVLIAVSLVPIVILFRFMARDEDVLL
ncbi:MAG TPA: iron ABC transporter permease [Casimicrobiaceae bacterium]|nr:iron ABC transporter permease [Casimicrobiaceae bacterium]